MSAQRRKCKYPSCYYEGTQFSTLCHENKCPHRKRFSDCMENQVSMPATKRVQRLRNVPIALGGNASNVPADNIELHDDDLYQHEQKELAKKSSQADKQLADVLAEAVGQGNDSQIESAAKDTSGQPLSKENKEPSKNSELLVETFGILLASLAKKTGERSIDELIEVLSNPDFSLELFKENCSSASDCQSLVKSFFRTEIVEQGFRRHTISDPNGMLSCQIFSKDPIEVLRRQIALANSENCFFRPVKQQGSQGEDCYGHPMAAELGTIGTKAVMDAIKRSEKKGVIWNTMETDGKESFVGFAQIYSDKSSTTTKVNAFTFYPVHITLHNFSEELRRHCISEGLSIVGYLPIAFTRENVSTDHVMRGFTESAERPGRIRMLHLAAAKLLGGLRDVADMGFECKDKDGTQRMCHVALGSYCCDIPEGKDMTCVLHGIKTYRCCLRCYVAPESLSSFSSAPFRLLQHTQEARLKHHSLLREVAELRASGQKAEVKTKEELSRKQLSEISVTDQVSFLESFPFVNTVPCLDLYALFVFEPMHNFHLGISKLLKIAASSRLTSKAHFTRCTRNGQPRTFSSMRTAILNGANHILACIDEDSPVRGVRVDFSSKGKGKRFNGLFNATGLIGMLEAKDYRSLDMVFPFIGAYFDRCCDEVNTAPTTTAFVNYSDILHRSHRRNLSSGWTVGEVCELESLIASFKDHARKLYEDFQVSGMGTLKFHLLDHIGADIRRMGGLQFCDAGIYEHSHVRFKEMYRGTSKRRDSVMEETIQNMERQDAIKHWNQVSTGPLGKSLTFTRKHAMENDGAQLVRDGRNCTLQDLHEGRIRMRDTRKHFEVEGRSRERAGISNFGVASVQGLLEDLGEDGAHCLEDLLQELATEQCQPAEARSGILISRVSSAWVAGGFVPTLQDYNEQRNCLNFGSSSRRVSQRIVAARNFYGTNRLRQDCVLIAGQSGSGPDAIDFHATPWVGKALALLRVRLPSTPSKPSEPLEFAFVQYMECVPPCDTIDRVLDCVSLRWSRHDGDNEINQGTVTNTKKGAQEKSISPGRWFGLVEAGAIRGTLHVLRKNYGVGGISDEPTWTDQLFYINRFYRDPGEVEYVFDETNKN